MVCSTFQWRYHKFAELERIYTKLVQEVVFSSLLILVFFIRKDKFFQTKYTYTFLRQAIHFIN